MSIKTKNTNRGITVSFMIRNTLELPADLGRTFTNSLKNFSCDVKKLIIDNNDMYIRFLPSGKRVDPASKNKDNTLMVMAKAEPLITTKRAVRRVPVNRQRFNWCRRFSFPVNHSPVYIRRLNIKRLTPIALW